MRLLQFKWVRRVPEDFIVREVSDFELSGEGNFHLYLLVKRNLSTRDVCSRFDLSYAGMKDKFALTVQKVSSERYLGSFVREELKGGWFILKHLGRLRKKIRIGQLKGNRFAVNVSGFPMQERDYFINYYDVQRVCGAEDNWRRGKELFRLLFEKPRKRLRWSENFLIDSYLSHLWNRSLGLYLMDRFSGYWIEEKGYRFFIPTDFFLDSAPKFWTVLGYKKKLLESGDYYERVLREEGFNLEEFVELLRFLRVKGDYRMLYVLPRGVKRIGNYLFFFLPKGAFATMFLKHLQE